MRGLELGLPFPENPLHGEKQSLIYDHLEDMPEFDNTQGTIFDSSETPFPTSGTIEIQQKGRILSGRELNEALSSAHVDPGAWTFGRDSMPGNTFFNLT